MKTKHFFTLALVALSVTGFMGHHLYAETDEGKKSTLLARGGTNTIDRLAQVEGTNKKLQFSFIGDENTFYTLLPEDAMSVTTISIFTGDQTNEPIKGLWVIGIFDTVSTTTTEFFPYFEDGRQQFHFDPPIALIPGEERGGFISLTSRQ